MELNQKFKKYIKDLKCFLKKRIIYEMVLFLYAIKKSSIFSAFGKHATKILMLTNAINGAIFITARNNFVINWSDNVITYR